MHRNNIFPNFLLIGISFLIIFFLVCIPVSIIFLNALREGFGIFFQKVTNSDTISAIQLNLTIALFTIPFNLITGIILSICIARFDFFGKSFWNTLIDLPFSVSPIVSGLTFLLIFGRKGFAGNILNDMNIQILFALPGMLLATAFVSFPFVAREVLPVLQSSGEEEEEAAFTLGAGFFTIFFKITLPKIKWGLIYGVVLCNARIMGEFGAISMVSGHITGLTDTLPLRIEKLYTEYDTIGAFSVSLILLVFSLFSLLMKYIFEKKVIMEVDYK
ncbi:MAG: sulfate ABC transporter permease [Leptospiraceae bacterium]|nr:sulfate ABC transporter permease [Leptospiraceae bacterium]MCP5512216.1 sulfate ABC transporter permease [Leptospiraceae bacterium]